MINALTLWYIARGKCPLWTEARERANLGNVLIFKKKKKKKKERETEGTRLDDLVPTFQTWPIVADKSVLASSCKFRCYPKPSVMESCEFVAFHSRPWAKLILVFTLVSRHIYSFTLPVSYVA